jgi:N-acetylneuraminate synthase
MHIADAKGVDGEGLQIGEGDMDFVMFTSIIEKKMPTASFIPEVWQGHKNNGEGFWVALDRLEDIMMHS